MLIKRLSLLLFILFFTAMGSATTDPREIRIIATHKDYIAAAHAAARKDDINALINCVMMGVDINSVDEDFGILLGTACYAGSKRVVMFLLSSNIDVNLTDNNGCTALMLAAEQGRLEFVKLLLAQHASVDDYASKKRGQTALHIAIANKHHDIVREIIKASTELNTRDSADWSPLSLATETGCADTVKILLAHGANANLTYTNSNITVLHYAAMHGKTEIVRTLITAGANYNMCDTQGVTPLLLAAVCGHMEIVKILIAYDNSVVSIAGAFIMAILKGHTELAIALIDAGIPQYRHAKTDDTFLHIAARKNNPTIIRRLLSLNTIDIASTNKDNKRPVDLASDPECIALLAENHVKPSQSFLASLMRCCRRKSKYSC